MNRGSSRAQSAPGKGVPGFNEAPIHESGKSHGTYHQIRRPSRFNEAPIHESGKYAA